MPIWAFIIQLDLHSFLAFRIQSNSLYLIIVPVVIVVVVVVVVDDDDDEDDETWSIDADIF